MITTTNTAQKRQFSPTKLWREVSFQDPTPSDASKQVNGVPQSEIREFAGHEQNGVDANLVSRDALIKENSPKNAEKTEQNQSSSNEEYSSDLIVLEDSENGCGDTGEWEPIEQATVAVDYSNAPVFLKTLRNWQGQQNNEGVGGSEQRADLQVNLDEALCQQLFMDFSKPSNAANSRQAASNGGFISLDASNLAASEQNQQKSKLTWYKSDCEPCMGTSLFFEVPVKGTAVAPTPVPATAFQRLKESASRRSISRGKRTLVLNPTREQKLKRGRSRALDSAIWDDGRSFGASSSFSVTQAQQISSHSPYKRHRALQGIRSGVHVQGTSGDSEELCFLGMNSMQVSLRSKVQHSTAAIQPVPQLLVTMDGQKAAAATPKTAKDDAIKREARLAKQALLDTAALATEIAPAAPSFKLMENGISQMRPPSLALSQQQYRATAVTETKIKVERLVDKNTTNGLSRPDNLPKSK